MERPGNFWTLQVLMGYQLSQNPTSWPTMHFAHWGSTTSLVHMPQPTLYQWTKQTTRTLARPAASKPLQGKYITSHKVHIQNSNKPTTYEGNSAPVGNSPHIPHRAVVTNSNGTSVLGGGDVTYQTNQHSMKLPVYTLKSSICHVSV